MKEKKNALLFTGGTGFLGSNILKNIVDSGDADLLSMCRPLIREPGLIARWQRGEEKPARCISCNKCMRIVMKGEPLLECKEEHRLREEASAAG